jgi:signal peptidase
LFSALIAKELARDYLVNGSGRNAKFGDCIFAAVFIYLLSFNPDQFVNLETNLQIIQFISIDMIAKLCISGFATYLVFIGGPALSILYLGIHDGFFWFCPILPNLSWIAQAFIEILLPASSLMLMRYSYRKRSGFLPREKDTENPLGWIVDLVVSILIIWFTVGVFPVRPYVIITGSMIPVIYPGDIVLVKRDIDNLKTGEIIQYKSGDIYIFHRITEIVEEEKDTYLYITKGDNNSSEDPKPVGIDNIRGRVIYTVPKVGYLALLLYQY